MIGFHPYIKHHSSDKILVWAKLGKKNMVYGWGLKFDLIDKEQGLVNITFYQLCFNHVKIFFIWRRSNILCTI